MACRQEAGVSIRLRGEIAEEATGKTVAGAGGVDDLFEREGRSFEGAELRFLTFWSRFVE